MIKEGSRLQMAVSFLCNAVEDLVNPPPERPLMTRAQRLTYLTKAQRAMNQAYLAFAKAELEAAVRWMNGLSRREAVLSLYPPRKQVPSETPSRVRPSAQEAGVCAVASGDGWGPVPGSQVRLADLASRPDPGPGGVRGDRGASREADRHD